MSRAELLALFFLGSLAFFNAIWHPFVHDDVLFILKNPHIADLEHWYDAFSSPVVSEGTNTYYRPALEILYRLEYRLLAPILLVSIYLISSSISSTDFCFLVCCKS